MYSKRLYVAWSDMDPNGHMSNTAYLDKVADVRQMFLLEHGCTVEEFRRLGIGAVLRKDEIEYFRELGLQQQIEITYTLAGHSPDGSRAMLRNEFFRPDRQLSARVTSTLGWLDLASRKLTAPPPVVLSAMSLLERTSDFVVLPSSIRQQGYTPSRNSAA